MSAVFVVCDEHLKPLGVYTNEHEAVKYVGKYKGYLAIRELELDAPLRLEEEK